MNRNHAPIQNEEGLLAFTLEDIIDSNANPHLKELAPKELQRPFIINLNYKKEREECAKKINEITHECFAWTKEKFGKRHWVLYNTKAFRVILGGIIH